MIERGSCELLLVRVFALEMVLLTVTARLLGFPVLVSFFA